MLLTRHQKSLIIHAYTLKGADMQAKQAKKQIDSLMLQLQDMLEIVGLDEHDRIQTAFNALACELDDVLYPE